MKQYIYRYDKAANRTSEQIDNAVSAALTNGLNQVTSLSATGPVRFEGSLNEAGTVSVNGVLATVAADNSFKADVTLPPGSNTVSVVAKDNSNNSTTKSYSVIVATGANRILVYDLNGNLTDNGAGQTYGWDAANRLISITQANGVTGFVYDGLGRRVRETFNGTIIKQWIWCDRAQPCEERDASNNVIKRFYSGFGEQIGSSNYYFTSDHLGSVREMTDSSAAIHARYDYDSFGRITKLAGDIDSDSGFTGFYRHQSSGLNLTIYRAYDADLGRWLARDTIGEEGGINLYGYVSNNSVCLADEFGLKQGDPTVGLILVEAHLANEKVFADESKTTVLEYFQRQADKLTDQMDYGSVKVQIFHSTVDIEDKIKLAEPAVEVVMLNVHGEFQGSDHQFTGLVWIGGKDVPLKDYIDAANKYFEGKAILQNRCSESGETNAGKGMKDFEKTLKKFHFLQ